MTAEEKRLEEDRIRKAYWRRWEPYLIDCQILDRNGNKPFPYERGWKDVFYVGENESVRVIGKFGPHTGLFMSHCHNAVHEDYDMMNQFQVGQGGSDPMSAPAQPLPAPPL